MPKKIYNWWLEFWKDHGTKILGVVTFLVAGADFLLVEILEVLPVQWRGYVKLLIMGLAYAVIHRGRSNSNELRANRGDSNTSDL